MEQKDLTLQNLKGDLDVFRRDSITIGNLTEKYLSLVYPSYLLEPDDIEEFLDEKSAEKLRNMTFFRLQSCTVDSVDKAFERVNEKIEKLFTGLHSIGVSIGYGLVSKNGVTNLILGVYMESDMNVLRSITQGMLSGIEMDNYQPDFSKKENDKNFHGILSGVPSLYVREQKQEFSLSSIMRSLNGSEYTLLFLAKPVPKPIVIDYISELVSVRDEAFAVSKRNIARSMSYATTKSHAENVSDTKNGIAGQVGGIAGTALGAAIGTVIAPGVGTATGAAIGGGLGATIGSIFGGKSHSEGYSDSIAKAITKADTVSSDIQNGFALELMNYADKAIERLKNGHINGVWQTAMVFSADSAESRNIIKACLSGELSKPDSDKLPLAAFEPKEKEGENIRIPQFLEGGNRQNSLCSYLTSSELGLLCTVPTESVPDFEIRIRHDYPMVRSTVTDDSVVIGNLADGRRALQNMPFALTHSDLNKHTFVCGLTGSGKTTTVKKILVESQVPFLVIESAKKEYRNIIVNTNVFTLGRPEINCPQMNPFYVMPGVNLQTHIDYIKDLFNASFSFYGPMPYILEKCLYSVYENKGWNLTLGYHPLLVNKQSRIDFFDASKLGNQYSNSAHKYLFPTMQDLKNEITRYVEEELKYDGEVAGNVKTAMKVRLENLCNGAKGFSFNTYEYLDLAKILSENVVFELEGLADDSDKAFCVGLLVIYINEFRQMQKELAGVQRMELSHLLVIEEAHRLLKNVNTERSTEEIGNPKGKAVEHFTNMIAEMRSYGQGVIVAEQIPSKLAPDVIKNSSNKIVQRIVSIDDQKTMANTIGMPADDAIQLGIIEAGYAFCHKEGMALPTLVKITDIYIKDNKEQKLDGYVSDEILFNKNEECFEKINYNIVRTVLDETDEMKQRVFSLLNTLLIESPQNVMTACDCIIKETDRKLKKDAVSLVFCNDRRKILAEYLTSGLLCFLLNGVYAVKKLPSDKFIEKLENLFFFIDSKKVNELKKELTALYGIDCAKLAKRIVVNLILRDKKESTDVKRTILGYFTIVSDETLNELGAEIYGGIDV